MCILNPQGNPMREVPLLSNDMHEEALSQSLRIKQLVSYRAKIQTQSVWVQNSGFETLSSVAYAGIQHENLLPAKLLAWSPHIISFFLLF